MLEHSLRSFVLLALLVPVAAAGQDAMDEPTSDEAVIESAPLAPENVAPAPAAVCVPDCRPGFTCIDGQCVSACNPPCGTGTHCDASAMCVADAAPVEEARTERAGGSFAGGLEFDYARPIYLATYMGDEYGAHGPAVSFGASFRFDYGFNDRVFLGARVNIGRILSSDDSTGTALRAGGGLALTFFATRGFFLGIDLGVEYMSYDDLSVKFSDADRFDGPSSESIADIDGETLVLLNAGLHLGGLFSINDRVGIYTELKIRSSIKTLVLEGVDVDHESPEGSCCDRDDPDTVIVPAVSLGVGTRLFF